MFKKVFQYANEYKKKTYLSIIVLITAVIFSIIPYFMIYRLINPLLNRQDISLSYCLLHIAVIVLCMIIHGVLYVKGLALSHESAYHTLKNIRTYLQDCIEKLPLGVIQEKGNGVLKKMFIDDIDSIELLLAHAVPEGIANASIPVIILVAMFFIDWKLALLSLCSLPFGIISMMIMYRVGMKEMANYYASAGKMNNTIIEYVQGMEVVKVFNHDAASYKRLKDDVTSYRDFTLKWYQASWPWMALYSSILPCIALFTLPIGSYLVLQGYSTLTNFILILCLSFGMGVPILKALNFMSTFPQLNYKIEALEKLMASEPLKQNGKAFMGEDFSIKYDHVCFSYDKDEVIHDVSLNIPQGQMVAFVGESGSGKSTLAKLLVHFYDVQSGKISIGGQNISDMSIEQLNKQISYVSQEQFLFNTTLKENIRYGKMDATDDEILQAAKQAQCNDFISRLEKGIDTTAGDGGKQLSGGERQRISLARAILKDAPIVVLDEATAFIDSENEDKMNQAISQIIQNKTVIVIAHRLPSIVNADQIIVMKKGKIDGIGKHEDLLKNNAEYQKLWNAATASHAWKIETKEEKFYAETAIQNH
ncbi:MAG: ABC transporter ATP-binding protein [Thomasclavelia sp.]